jgi:glycosyltransferase involved in cell wall biosynthesis
VRASALKILQVTKYYYPAVSFGGPVQCAYNLSKYLAKRGHEITVYTTDALSPRGNARISERVRIIEGAEVHFFANVARFQEMFTSPAMIRAFRDCIGKYDIVHLHEYRTFQNIAFLFCNGKSQRYVLQAHGVRLGQYVASEGKTVRVCARIAYDHLFGNRLLKHASKVIAVSKSEKTLLERIGAEKENIVVIPNGVSPEDFCDLSGPDFFRKRFGIGEETVILYMGRIAKMKGIDTLVKAFYLLCRTRSDLKLAIVGPDFGYLHSLTEIIRHLNIEEKVVFAGLLTGQDRVSAYSSADAVVYPAIHEGFPIVPLEAAVMGKPIVVSSDPGMDFVREGGFGLSFQYGNEYELARCLDGLLEDRELGRRQGEQGKKCVLENYTWEAVSGRIEQLYRRIL